MPSFVIETNKLTKRFGTFLAVDNVSLKVKEGEIFGFLGPNGAGKTTTINILTTLIKPTAGTAKVGGFDLAEEGVGVRSIIGVVPQTFALFPELSAQENLDYIGKLYGMTPSLIAERSRQLLRTVALYEHKDRISGTFSGGMKQRLSLAASIISHPKILFMDEPTTGLDPQSRIAMRELTKSLNKEGITVIYTTHDMEEAEKICHRITIMDHGRIVADGTAAELKAMVKQERCIEVEIDHPSKEIIEELKALPFVSSVKAEENIIIICVKEKEGVFFKLSDFFARRRQKVSEIRFKEHTLEDVFIHLTKKALRD
jgi:ABC-2 type transport system ATP-binding protein